MAWLSLRAYAKHRGCSLSAVQRAISSGRLAKAVGKDGRGDPKIMDAAAADAEWAATTHAEKVPHAVEERNAARRLALVPPAPPDPPDPNAPPDLAVSRARREAAEAALAELELAEKQGKYLPAEDVEGRLVDVFSQCKTKLLGIPARARQQDPDLSPAQIAALEALLREALEDLAAEARPAPAEALEA